MFNGFSEKTPEFFWELVFNNDRTWLHEHKEEFDRLLNRPLKELAEEMPFGKRLAAFAQDHNDPSLVALYYQFGRYLLISSTRPGCLSPNLQGLWALANNRSQ